MLLLLTDGDVNDVEATEAAIARAAAASALSIIIVGVGEGANFDYNLMRRLDNDAPEPGSGGGAAGARGASAPPAHRAGTRDIVQFVPFCNYGKTAQDAERLASVRSRGGGSGGGY